MNSSLSCFLATILFFAPFVIPSKAAAQEFEEILISHRLATKHDDLEHVRSIIWKGTETFPQAGDKYEYELVQLHRQHWQTVQKGENHSYTETYYQGNTWTHIVQGEESLTQPMTFETISTLGRTARWASPILDAELCKYEIQYVGKTRQERQVLHEFKVYTSEGDGLMVYLDPETYLISMIRDQRVLKGILQGVEIRYSDYREAWGVPFAHTVTYYQQNQPIRVYEFSSITFNPELDEARWNEPASTPPPPVSPDVLMMQQQGKPSEK